jgi:hypothetical protein
MFFVCLAFTAFLTAGCGADSGSGGSGGGSSEPLSELSEPQIKDALATLPYTIKYRPEQFTGDGAAVAGTASNGRTSVQFEIVSGTPEIENPLFPQGNVGLSAQRAVNDAYTLTVPNSHGWEESKAKAPLINDIGGALCELADTCGGPAG